MKFTKVLLSVFAAALFAVLPSSATVPSESAWLQYTYHGPTLPVTFVFQNAGDLRVLDTRTPAAPVTLTLNSDYSVSGGSGATGTVAIIPGGAHGVISGDVITISRAVPLTQNTSFTNTGPLTAAMIGQALDKLTEITQQGAVKQAVSLQFPGDEVQSGVLPLASRKSKYLAFDANGNIQFTSSTGIIGSSFIVPTGDVGEFASGSTLQVDAGAHFKMSGYIGLYYDTTNFNSFATSTANITGTLTGQGNVGMGWGTLQSLTSGNLNTAVGVGALLDITVGQANTAFGCNAVYQMQGATSGLGTSGNDNTGVGYQTLYGQTGGTFNTAIGDSAMAGPNANQTGSYNTALGGYTLYSLQNADNNTAGGYDAGLHLTTGHDNLLLGYGAGLAATTISSTTLIGPGTSATDGITNATALGNGATATASNQMYYGNASVTAHNFNGALAAIRSTNGAFVNAFQNSSTGTSAFSAVYVQNFIHTMLFGQTSTTYSGAFFTNGPTGEQGLLGTLAAFPVVIGTNGTAALSFDSVQKGTFYAATAQHLTTLTYASPTVVTMATGNVFKMTTVNATGSVTFNADGGGMAGQRITLIIVNDATSGKTITFGTNFKPKTSTLVGTTSTTSTIEFISDGTSLFEVSRIINIP